MDLLNCNFKKIRILGNIRADDRSMRLVPNHFSRWNGFWVWKLNLERFKKKFYWMMFERELAGRRFFTKLGAFSMLYIPMGIIESLRLTIKVNRERNNHIVFYPQGIFFSLYLTKIKFQSWLKWIMKLFQNFKSYMLANHIDYCAYPKPSLTLYLQKFSQTINFNLSQFKRGYNLCLEQNVHKQDKIFRS